MGLIINRILLALALVVLLAMTAFIYFQYPVKWRKNPLMKYFLAFVHGAGSICMAIIFTCYSKLDNHVLKWIVSHWGSVYFMTVILLFLLFGSRFLISLVISQICGKERTKAFHDRHPLLAGRTVHSLLFLAISVAITLAGFMRVDDIIVQEYSWTVSKPAELEEIGIIMMSDIHAGAGMWDKGYNKIEQYVRNISPDVILIGGDLFDETTSPRDMEYTKELLESVSPKYGTFFVYGNHDPEIETWLSTLGVKTLKDEKVMIGDDIQLVGRLDSSSYKDISSMFDSVQVDSEKPVITIQHRPVEFNELSQQGCDLVLAGHTHGISFPFCFLIEPVNDMLTGSMEYNSMLAVTSSGASAWGIHYKWPSRSDIVYVHLTFGGTKE